MTTEGALARRKLSEEIGDGIAKPARRHDQDKRIAMFETLAVTHHEHVHAAPETHIERSSKLHHQPREQMVDFDLRERHANVDGKNHEEGHSHHVRHGRKTKESTLRKSPGNRKGQGCRKRKVAGIRALVHFACHAGPFPGADTGQKTHQSYAAVVAEPQQEEYDRNGDKRRN